MNPQENKRVQMLKALAMPNMPPTPTPQSCLVERTAIDIVLDGECRRKTVGCAICTLSELSCEAVNAFGTGYDSLGRIGTGLKTLRGDGPGFAG